MDLPERLRAALERDPRVVAAWLYGSRARGTQRPDSDVDIAILARDDRARRVAFQVKKHNEYVDMTPIWRLIRRLPPGVDP